MRRMTYTYDGYTATYADTHYSLGWSLDVTKLFVGTYTVDCRYSLGVF